MHAVPPFHSADEVDGRRGHRCLLCGVEDTTDPADPGWVRCPLVGDQFVCLGSCLEFQSVARSRDFERHAARDLFDALANDSGRSRSALRLACLRHQLQELDAQLHELTDDQEALERLRADVRDAITRARIG